MRRLIGSLALMMVLGTAVASGQEAQPFDGFRAGEEAHNNGEVQRRQRLNDQLYLSDAMRARYGWVPSANVVWYGNAAGYGPAVSIDSACAYSSDRFFGRARGLYVERYWSPPHSVFEPWPYVPGDIYGYSFPPYVRQSIGQRQIQTGPNRWESHPIYPGEVVPAAESAEPTGKMDPTPGAEIESPPPPPPDDETDKLPPTDRKPRRYYF